MKLNGLLMDIKNKIIENACANLTRKFSNYFDWNDVDLSISYIDMINKNIKYYQIIMNGNLFILMMIWI